MMQREFLQHPLPFWSQRQQNLSPVLPGLAASYQSAHAKPVNEFDRAVMLDLQSLGDFSDSRPNARWQPLQSQHQLMLPWFQTSPARYLFTEIQETPNLMP